MEKKILQSVTDAVRILSAEAIEKAKSGHPGTPLGAAPIAVKLYGECMKHNPKNPDFFDRDRFILSAGHASAMLYSTLHLCGYDVTKEDLASFRQLHSKLPGHPEYGVTPGVETSTGPLGQGIANGVGFALAEKILANKYNTEDCKIVDHYTYVFSGDGCLMEGMSYEAAALAGVWKLGKLILIYDKNDITIEGDISATTSEDVRKRFESQGWQVLSVEDGNDTDAFGKAVEQAKADAEHPSVIIVKTVIGFGSSKAGNESCHGAPLGEECLVGLKKALNWKEEPFTAPKETSAFTDAVCLRGEKAEKDWNRLLEKYKSEYPDKYAAFKACIEDNDLDLIGDEDFWKNAPTGNDATRNHSGKILNYLADRIEGLIGGSADLGPSNMTIMKKREYYSADVPTGTNIHFGVREAAMSAICNGLALHGGFSPYCSTFFVFSDYMKGSIRMSALMKLPVLYILSHDSIGVGEDGATHQPIEHLTMLRTIPNLNVWRPCSGEETAAAYAYHFTYKKPTAIVTSRQKLVSPEGSCGKCALKGGYTISDSMKEIPDVIIMGTGSEVSLLIDAQKELKTLGVDARVVSMPCLEEFDAQSEEYKESVLPKKVRARVAVEAGSSTPWFKYVGLDGVTVCKDDFGESAPAAMLFEKNNFTSSAVVRAAMEAIKKAAE